MNIYVVQVHFTQQRSVEIDLNINILFEQFSIFEFKETHFSF